MHSRIGSGNNTFHFYSLKAHLKTSCKESRRQPRSCADDHCETATWLSPTIIPSGIPGGILLPVYYVSPYQFVTCMRWHTRVPTHTRTEHLYQKMNLRNGIEQNATRQTTRRHQTTHRKWSQGTGTRNLNQQQKEWELARRLGMEQYKSNKPNQNKT